jgi:acyl-CoA reductase-like NAD-dependent aldehyde dehydrogenase
MNRRDLTDAFVSGIQNSTTRLTEIGRDLFDDDEVSPALDNYKSAAFCRTTARTVRIRAAQVAAIAAELYEHAGMLDALSHMPDGEPEPSEIREIASALASSRPGVS